MSKFHFICKHRSFFGLSIALNQSLYFSESSLVEVSVQTYSEEYKKIELENIQVIITKPTKSFGIKLTIYAILTMLMLLGLLSGDTVGVTIFTVLSIIFAIPFIMTLIHGRTCEVHVITAVGDYPLRSIGTYKNYFKFIETIKRIILPIQGTISAEEIQNNIEEYRSIQSRT
ncbi:MAG: hypothetical protein COA79_02735 [Planctomycetota bacterium]|nr:MAG: hypothetical protein COA79_02735 [Planctomycetota bacterium]